MHVTLEEIISCGVDEARAAGILSALSGENDPVLRWQALSRDLLRPDDPFELHRFLFAWNYVDRRPSLGPAPAWVPGPREFSGSNVARLMCERGFTGYPELFNWSVRDRAGFWEEMVQRLGIRLRERPWATLDASRGAEHPRWLPGARMNIAESCFQADPASPAVVFADEGGPIRTMAVGELDRLSDRVAAGLDGIGLAPGAAVAVDMPMTVESVAIYLGILKAGMVVVSIADSFASEEIAVRLRIGGAAAIFTGDCILRAGRVLPLYEKVKGASAPRAIVLPAAAEVSIPLRDGDLTWDDFLPDADRFDLVRRDPDDLVNVLFSSGTTGEPKAIPWTQTTPIKCASDGHLHQDIRPGMVVAWPTNLGWMMGPWLIFATLINRGTIALYQGAPGPRGFPEFVRDAGVNVLGLVPSLVRVWRASGAIDGIDWSAIRAFSSTGECSNPEDMHWLMSRAGYRPVIEYCGGTEIGGGYVTGTVVQPCAPATFTTPALGLDFHLLDAACEPSDAGEVFLVPPSMGLSDRLLNRDHHEVYYKDAPKGPHVETLRRHGDVMERLPGGYFRAQGRADDTMNLGGIKVGATQIERILDQVHGVKETAAIAVPPPGGGPDRLFIFAVAGSGAERDPGTLRRVFQQALLAHLNPLFRVHEVRIEETLPRTASQKVMRRVLRDSVADRPEI